MKLKLKEIFNEVLNFVANTVRRLLQLYWALAVVTAVHIVIFAAITEYKLQANVSRKKVVKKAKTYISNPSVDSAISTKSEKEVKNANPAK